MVHEFENVPDQSDILADISEGGEDCPSQLFHQQATFSSVFIQQVLSNQAPIWVKVPAGILLCHAQLAHQHTVSQFVFIQQVC